MTDADKLHQILFHIVENAVKFTAEGEVRLAARQYEAPLTGTTPRTILECTVSDTGPGIPPEQIDMIFEEFRQLDRSLARRHGGMGLGLSVCRGLVQLLRGEITVDSTVGSGSIFTVRIPVEPVHGRSEQSTDSVPPPIYIAR